MDADEPSGLAWELDDRAPAATSTLDTVVLGRPTPEQPRPGPPEPQTDWRHRRTPAWMWVALLVVLLVVLARAVNAVSSPTVPIETVRATDVAPATAATGAVLDHWWGRQLAARDLEWVPVGERLTDGDGSLACDGEPIVLDELLTDNAFATWCDEGPTVAYDPHRFVPDAVTTQAVLAHEWGHLVQFRNPSVDLPSIDPANAPAERELQADCFAGAWAAEHVVGEFHAVMLVDIGSFGDPEWVPIDDEHGHGTAAERTAAYETGVQGGVDACLPPTFDPR